MYTDLLWMNVDDHIAAPQQSPSVTSSLSKMVASLSQASILVQSSYVTVLHDFFQGIRRPTREAQLQAMMGTQYLSFWHGASRCRKDA